MSDEKTTSQPIATETEAAAAGADAIDAEAIRRALEVAARSPHGPRWWRDSRRRRLLALADCCSAGFAVALVLPPERAIWTLAFLPVWILVAKLARVHSDREQDADACRDAGV